MVIGGYQLEIFLCLLKLGMDYVAVTFAKFIDIKILSLSRSFDLVMSLGPLTPTNRKAITFQAITTSSWQQSSLPYSCSDTYHVLTRLTLPLPPSPSLSNPLKNLGGSASRFSLTCLDQPAGFPLRLHF